MSPLEKIRTKSDLIEYIIENEVEYLHFWGHKKTNKITSTCCSQWYPSPFKISDVVYQTAEHYMMTQKARLFGNNALFDTIINTSHPNEAKKLGRTVQGFDPDVWDKHKMDIVIRANIAKFTQHKGLSDYLLGTGDKIIVEASPYDRIWGIGMSKDHENANKPSKWVGLNLLGFALMEVRETLRARVREEL